MRFFRGVIFCFLLFAFSGLFAQHPVVQLKQGEENKLQEYMEVFVLAEGSKKKELIAIQDSSSQSRTNFGFFAGEIWARFQVKGSKECNSWMLELAYPFYNRVEIYEERRGAREKVFSGGDHLPFSQRLIQHRNFLVPFVAGENDTVNFYVHIISNGEATALPFSIWSKELFLTNSSNQQTALGVYYGIIVFALVLSVFMLLLLQERKQYYYFGYLFGIGLFQFSLDGFGFQFLWPEFPMIANHIIPFSGSMAAGFLLLFTGRLLQIKVYFPRLCRAMMVNAVILFSIMAMSVFGNPFFTWALKSANLFALLANLMVFIAGILAYRKGVGSSGYFIVAFSLLISGALLALFKNFGWLPRVFVTEYGLQLGSAVEIMLLSLGLASNIRMLKSENEKVQAQLLEELKEKYLVQEKAKEELEIKVAERTAEISEQKMLIEQKNKDITDSILYARRIQDAIGTSEEELKVYFPDAFLFMQPRDIVNGDFFWMTQQNGCFFLAIADCTGHGVPGALMSMIGNTFLNEIVNNYEVTETSEILDLLRIKVIKLLRQNESDSKDGMDIALLRISLKKKELQFSGAFNPMVFISAHSEGLPDAFNLLLKKEGAFLYQVPASRFPVGIVSGSEHKAFQSFTWNYRDEDRIYLFSDGYADQFGGERGKKFKPSRLYELLMLNYRKEMAEQKQELMNNFQQWKGKEEQVDDVSILGLKF